MRSLRDSAVWTWSALGALVVVAVVIRLMGFQQWWLNPDEAMYVRMATAPREIALEMIAENAHPPLFYWILRGMAAISEDPRWLRLSALLPGVCLVPACFLLGTRVSGHRAGGLAAAALVTVAPGAVSLSQVVRPYMLQISFTALGLWGLLGYLEKDSRAGLGIYAMAASAALFLHYGTFVVLGGIGICLGVSLAAGRLSPTRLLHVALASLPLAAGAVYLYIAHVAPRVIGSAMQANARENWLREHFSSDLLQAGGGLFDAAVFACGQWPAVLVSGLGVIGVLLLVIRRRIEAASLLLGVPLTAGVLTMLGLYPLGGSRHSLYLVVILLPAFACALMLAPIGRYGTRAAGGVLLVLILQMASAWSGGEKPPLTAPERVILREEAQILRRWFRSEEASHKIFITDRQTSFLLWALLGQPEPPRGAGEGFEVFGAGGREFIKSSTWGWSLDWRRRSSLGPLHLGAVLLAVSRDPVWGPRLAEADPWVVQGGWGDLMVRGAPYVGAPLIRDVVGGRGFAVVRLNAPAYVLYLR